MKANLVVYCWLGFLGALLLFGADLAVPPESLGGIDPMEPTYNKTTTTSLGSAANTHCSFCQ